MSTQVDTQMTQAGKPAKVVPMRVTIQGRIEAMRSWGGVRHTRIITPSPDPYTRPQTVEVRSKEKLGERGDEITITAQLGGFLRKSFVVIDKNTGETSTVTPVDMTLDALDA